MSLDYKALKAEIVKHDGKTDAEIAAVLNAETTTETETFWINKVWLYNVLGFNRGLELLAAFKALAASQDAATALMFGEILDLLDHRSVGINVSDPETAKMFAVLEQRGILQTGEADKIAALGRRTRRKWIELHAGDIAAIRAMGVSNG